MTCSQNKRRSLTAEKIFNGVNGHRAYSAGTENHARVKVTAGMLSRADIIFCMEKKHIRRINGKYGDVICGKKVICLHIPDVSGIMKEVKDNCYYTHHHPEAITGASAIAVAIFLTRKDFRKEEIKEQMIKRFSYSLDATLDEIREDYVFDSRASYTVPVALEAFLESDSYEDAIRKAISVGETVIPLPV